MRDKREDDILVIWSGTNDELTPANGGETIKYIQSIIDYTGTDRYIVLNMEKIEDIPQIDEVNKAFDKAMESLVGVDYAPIACLGTQLVAGQNYCILCKATVVAPDAAPYLALVYVYADLEGNAEITHIQELDIAALSQDAE